MPFFHLPTIGGGRKSQKSARQLIATAAQAGRNTSVMNKGPIDILLVEDNKADMTLFLSVLKDAGLAPKMLIAWNGIEALSLMFEMGNPIEAPPVIVPKLIVLDLMLPKANGFELLSRLKSNPHTQHIPAVVLSSSGEKNNFAECYKLGVNSFLIKPANFEKFSEMVRTLVHYWLDFNQTTNL